VSLQSQTATDSLQNLIVRDLSASQKLREQEELE
jgi:hypothetical protein